MSKKFMYCSAVD